MDTQTIVLDLLNDNPYQPRLVDDPAHIEKLARSIAADGLQQFPKARKVEVWYELAFGHSRRKAFEWLVENYEAQGLPDRYDGYTCMPVEIEDLSDEAMFRLAVTENVQRKDLDPIEMAKSMKAYRDQFGKTSTEIGALYGMSDATVRGMIRLLDLPEGVQAKVSAGEISQGAARKLLTIARVDAKQIEQAVINITSGMQADEAVDQAMRDSDKAFVMWFGFQGGKPLAGACLWSLDKQFATPPVTDADVVKALELESNAQNRQQVKQWIEILTTGVIRGFDGVQEAFDGTPVEYLISKGVPADQVERLQHLINPPVCTACPFHSVSGKQHFCGFKACHKHKKKAWVEGEVQKVSKKLGIPVYDPSKDGKTFVALVEHTYMDEYKVHNKLVEAKNPDLRLQANFSEYSEHKWTGSHHARVIAVGETATKAKEKKAGSKSDERAEQERREREREISRALHDAARRFRKEYAAAVFAQVFQGLDNMHVMAALARVEIKKTKGTNKEQILNELRAELANDVLDNMMGWQDEEKGPMYVAKKYQHIATNWGVKLPADFLEVAKKYQPDVSVETKAKKK